MAGKNAAFYMRKYIVISSVIVAVMSLCIVAWVHASFTSGNVNMSNSFTTAAVFPTGEQLISPTATPTPTLTITPTPTPTGIATHIVISEVQTATPGASTSDFVELYNPTSSDINLNNFTLVKRTKTGVSDSNLKSFTSSNVIHAHGFYLWSSTDGGYNTQINADVSTGTNIADDNSIALKDSSNVIVDAVAWGSGHTAPLVEGSAFTPNPSAGQSIERKAYSTSTTITMNVVDSAKGNGYDTNNNATDFVSRTSSQSQNSSSSTETP